MNKKVILAGIGGLIAGAAGGFAGGYFMARKSCMDDFASQTEDIKRAYQEKYEADLKAEANRIAKEIIFRASEAAKEENVDEPSNAETEETESEDSDTDPDRKEPQPVYAHNNVFDSPVNPTEPVDYSSLSKGAKFTGQDQLESNLLRKESAASKSFGKTKQAQKEELDNAEAEQDLLDWYGQSRNRVGQGHQQANDSEIDELRPLREDHEADAEIDSQVREDILQLTPRGIKPGVFVIPESDYEVGHPMYTKSFVIYYDQDGVWTDEDYQPIEDPYQIVGCPDDLIFKGPGHENDLDRVFIRNKNIGTDYECVRYHRAYGDTALVELK